MCGVILQSQNPIINLFNKKLAKDDGTSLWKHSLGTLKVCDHLIKCSPAYDSKKAWQLRVAAFLHDIGKLGQDFQDYMNNKTSKPVKHEKHSLDYKEWASKNFVFISQIVAYYCETTPSKLHLEDIWGFIVSHHGIYYLEIKKDKWEVARDWTRVNTANCITVSLADLLWRYYPLGGAIIFADLIHSAYLNGNDLWNDIKKLNKLSDIKEKIANQCRQLTEFKGDDRRETISLDIMKLLLLN